MPLIIDKVRINVKLLREGVELPTYATEESSGIDARAYAYNYPNDLRNTYELKETTENQPDGFWLKVGERVLIRTGLAMAIPKGYEIQVRSRSGCALKYGIMLVNGIGTIDEDYRGEIGVILYNSSKEDFFINRGDRIAQLVLQKVPKVDLIVVDDLDETDRGEGGFGSTGVS
jgi:dUTP pyrophosphatase